MRTTIVRMTALAGLALGSCSSSPPSPSPDPHDPDGPGRLALEVAAPDQIRGTFTRNDLTLRFHATRTDDRASITVITASGDELFALDGDRSGTTVRMNGQDYLRSGDRVEAYASAAADGGTTEQCTATPESADAYVAFMAAPESALFPWLSAALGELGFDGRRYPATMLLHKLGMRVSRDLDIVPPAAIAAAAATACDRGDVAPWAAAAGGDAGPADAGGSDANPADGGVADAGAPACADISGNPNGNNCYGMCGNGCNCWRWVCGDCCCNNGCRQHDDHCRRCTADSRGNWWDCVQCACFDWGNPLLDCTKCS